MAAVKQELVDLSAEVWQRLRSRLDGLSDEEYLWEPAPGCWTVRQRDDGGWRADRALPGPEPEPFTTLAWRLWHLIDMYGEDRAPQWLDVPPQGIAIGLDDPEGSPPPTADEALELLDRAHDRWEAHLALTTDETLSQEIGPPGGGYANRTRVAFVLHMLDEFIHHGAEIALLRDLWRWQHQLVEEPDVERAMRGDLTLSADVDGLAATDASGLMGVAASYARWDLVMALASNGVDMAVGGTTPLHVAAAAGELGVVQALVERGADPTARDPEFDARPLEWARFSGQAHVAAWLNAHTDG